MTSKKGGAEQPIDSLLVLSDLAVGGTSRAAAKLAEGLAERGYRVGILVFTDKGPLSAALSRKVAHMDLGGLRTRYAIPALARKIAALRPKTVVGFLPHANVASIVATKIARTSSRIFVTEHTQPDPQLLRALSPGLLWSFRAAPLVYRQADAVVCCSEGIRAAWTENSGLQPDRIKAIYNPMITADLKALSLQPPTHPWCDDHATPLVVAVGRFSAEKDQSMLLRAFAQLRRQRTARLIIVGEGTMRSELEQLVGALGLSDDVDLPGSLENPYSLIRRADVLALSSTSEGFPYVMVEALGCGTPVVATKCLSDADQAMTHGWLHSVVPVGDDHAFAAALSQALDDAHDPLELANHVERFSTSAAIDAYEDLLFNGTGARHPNFRQ